MANQAIVDMFLADLKADEEAYDEYCRDLYESKGYGPEYCIHGTSLWTDYDNICGGCESGYSNEELAEAYADNYMRKFKDHVDHFNKAVLSINQMNLTAPQRNIIQGILNQSLQDYPLPSCRNW